MPGCRCFLGGRVGSASRALRSLGSGLELTVAGASPFAPCSATSLRFSWSRWRSRLSWCKSIDAPMHARTHACSHALRPCPPRARPCWAGETSWGSRAAVCGAGSMRNRFRVPRASWYHVALEDCPQIALKKTEPLLPTVPKGACGWVEEGVAGAQRRTCLARPVSSYADAGQSAHGEAARRAGSGWLPLPPRPQSPPCLPGLRNRRTLLSFFVFFWFSAIPPGPSSGLVLSAGTSLGNPA